MQTTGMFERHRTFRAWIADHRDELDECIARAIGQDKNLRPNDEERRLWVLNNEGLYNWAKSDGCRI